MRHSRPVTAALIGLFASAVAMLLVLSGNGRGWQAAGNAARPATGARQPGLARPFSQ